MTINGVEFDIDFTDADLTERFDKACEQVGEKASELEKNKENLTPAEGIRQECKIVKDFFDYVLGDGTSKKIFGKKDSLKMCLEAYEDIVQIRDEQFNDYYNKINKYSPERLQR